jgi:hypothetical protein
MAWGNEMELYRRIFDIEAVRYRRKYILYWRFFDSSISGASHIPDIGHFSFLGALISNHTVFITIQYRNKFISQQGAFISDYIFW